MPASDSPPETFIEFGRLGRVSGLRGEIRLVPFGEAEAAAIESLDEVYVEGLGRSAVLELRRQGRRWLVLLAGVRRREQAEPLVGARLFAPGDLLPERALKPSRGAPLELAGRNLGRVIEVRHGAQDLVVVQVGDSEVLLPLLAPYVSWDGRALTLIDPPAGLLPDGAGDDELP